MSDSKTSGPKILLACAAILLVPQPRAQAQGAAPAASAETAVEAPLLNKMPSPAEQAAFAKAEEAVLLPDLATLHKLFAGEDLKDAQLSLSGFAFLETFCASMMGPAGDPPQPQKLENTLRLDIYRIARKAITDKYSDPTAARDSIFMITRFRNSLLKTGPPFSLIGKWKEILDEGTASASGDKEMLRLPVSGELAKKIAALQTSEGSNKTPIVQFLDLQEKIARAEIALLQAKPK